MVLHWRAIGYGFIVSIALTLLSGFGLPFTDLSLPTISSAVSGLIAGAAAGYIAGPRLLRGAVNGAIATALGAVLGLILLSVLGVLVGGPLGAGIFIVGAVLALAQMVPGAIGGVIGSYLSDGHSAAGRNY